MMTTQDRPDSDPRSVARNLAEQAIEAGKPLEWFEQLYQLAESGDAIIPWADRVPNPNLMQLCDRVQAQPFGPAILIVGCGLGDDAEWFATRGFTVTAFDISGSAIRECYRRFPGSSVNYTTADLFEMPPAWERGFDVVVESYTLQVLPRVMRDKAIENICITLSPGGYLLVIARARDESDSHGSMPWPLTREETRQFLAHGLEEIYFEDYLDNFEDPPVRRFRGCFRKQA